MIASIEGAVSQIGPDFLVVKNHGLGFKVNVPKTLINDVDLYKEVNLHTYLLVREDALTLFGFQTASRRDFCTAVGRQWCGSQNCPFPSFRFFRWI